MTGLDLPGFRRVGAVFMDGLAPVVASFASLAVACFFVSIGMRKMLALIAMRTGVFSVTLLVDLTTVGCVLARGVTLIANGPQKSRATSPTLGISARTRSSPKT